MKIALKTLGCKANQADSDLIARQLLKQGWEIVSPREKADLYLINTCTVTQTADRKSRQEIFKIRHARPRAKVLVLGCGVKVPGNLYQKMAEVDFRAQDLKELARILEKLKRKGGVGVAKGGAAVESAAGEKTMAGGTAEGATAAAEGAVMGGKTAATKEVRATTPEATAGKTKTTFSSLARTRALIKIQEGCDNFCTYCIVPFARGRARSIPSTQILKEAREKEKQGFKEIVLTGINLGTWEENHFDLPDLIQKILKETSLPRIRLSSIELPDFQEKLEKFLVLLQNPRFCSHLHFPLQSGSDRILKMMNRHYSTSEFLKLCFKLKKLFLNLALTTDIMVGFPGEIEEDFQKTLNLARKIGFAKIHVFKFSPRKGTSAATLPNQISPFEKNRRSQILREIAEDLRKKFQKTQLKKVSEVLFEKKRESKWIGLTSNYLKTAVLSPRNLENQLRKVKLQKITPSQIIEGKVI